MPRRALDGVPRGVRVDHAHAVRAADAGRARHRAARLELRVPQGGRSARRRGATSAPRSRSRRCSCRTAWARSRARSRRAGSRPAATPAIRGRAGSTRRRSSAACSRSPCAPTSPPSTSCGRAPASSSTTMVEYFRRRAVVAVDRGGRGRVRRDLRAARRRPVRVRPARVAARCRSSSSRRLCGLGSLVLLVRRRDRGAAILAIGAVVVDRRRGGASRSGRTCCRSR